MWDSEGNRKTLEDSEVCFISEILMGLVILNMSRHLLQNQGQLSLSSLRRKDFLLLGYSRNISHLGYYKDAQDIVK